MIRPCYKYDADDLLAMAETFHAGYCDGQLDLDRASSLIDSILDDGVSFRTDNGFIGGVVVPHPFTGHPVLVELAWWSTDKTGIQLLNTFIQAGKDLNVKEIRMSTMGTSSKIAAKIIQRKGFAVAETQYSLTI
jgi:hypothetical protein